MFFRIKKRREESFFKLPHLCFDAGHATVWGKVGAGSISNCQVLCKIYNRAKEMDKLRKI